MNNLKQYILQCRKATEIQKLHKPAICDRYICACNSCNDNPTIYHIHDYDMDYLNKRNLTNVEPHYANLVRSADVCTFVAFYHERCEEYLSYIWLPYQHQLQTLVINKYRHSQRYTKAYHMHKDGFLAECMMDDIIRWADSDNKLWQGGKNKWWNSMEQLWLAFVMKERFDKKWNGEDWINNN